MIERKIVTKEKVMGIVKSNEDEEMTENQTVLLEREMIERESDITMKGKSMLIKKNEEEALTENQTALLEEEMIEEGHLIRNGSQRILKKHLLSPTT